MLKVLLTGILTLGLAFPGLADVYDSVSLDFGSGITFNGTVTFANDYSSALAVNGQLSGVGLGDGNLSASELETVSWVANPGTNSFCCNPGGSNIGPYGSAFLVDGLNYCDNFFCSPYYQYDYYIQLTWENLGGGNLDVVTDFPMVNQNTELLDAGNNYIYAVGGTITPTGSPLPEPGYFVVMLLCLGGALGVRLAFGRRRTTGSEPT
jgi:hypothetical protein